MDILILALALVCVIAPLGVAHRHARVPLVSPLHIVAYLALFGLLLKTIYMIFGGEMVFQKYSVSPSIVLAAYAFVASFVLCICVGYWLAAGRLRKRVNPQVARASVAQVRNPNLLLLISLAVAGIVISVILSNRGLGTIEAAIALDTIHALNSSKIVRIEGVEGYGESFAAIKIFLVIPSLALAVFAARYMVWHKKIDFASVVVFAALNVFLVFFKGSRFDLLFVFGTFVVLYITLGGRVSGGLIRNCVIGALLIVVAYVSMTTLRAQKESGQALAFDTQKAAEQIFGSTYFLDVNVPIMILENHKTKDFFWGSSYVAWTYAWVPRAVWPNKPAVTLGPYVKQEIFGISGTIGGVNPTGPGEAYLNFGWLGAFAGLILGWMYRWLEDLTLSDRGLTRRAGIWLYSVSIVPLVVGTLQSSFSGSIVSTAVETLLVVMTLMLTRRRISIGRNPPSVDDRHQGLVSALRVIPHGEATK